MKAMLILTFVVSLIFCTDYVTKFDKLTLIKYELLNSYSNIIIFDSKYDEKFALRNISEILGLEKKLDNSIREEKIHLMIKITILIKRNITESLRAKLYKYNFFKSQFYLTEEEPIMVEILEDKINHLFSNIVSLTSDLTNLLNNNCEISLIENLPLNLLEINQKMLKEYFLKTIDFKNKYCEFQTLYYSFIMKIEIYLNEYILKDSFNFKNHLFWLNFAENFQDFTQKKLKNLRTLYIIKNKKSRKKKSYSIIQLSICVEHKKLEYLYNFIWGADVSNNVIKLLLSSENYKKLQDQIYKNVKQKNNQNLSKFILCKGNILLFIQETSAKLEKNIFTLKNIKSRILTETLEIIKNNEYLIYGTNHSKNKLNHFDLAYRLQITKLLNEFNKRVANLKLSIYFDGFIKFKIIRQVLVDQNYKNLTILKELEEKINYFREQLSVLGIIYGKNDQFLFNNFENIFLNFLCNGRLKYVGLESDDKNKTLKY